MIWQFGVGFYFTSRSVLSVHRIVYNLRNMDQQHLKEFKLATALYSAQNRSCWSFKTVPFWTLCNSYRTSWHKIKAALDYKWSSIWNPLICSTVQSCIIFLKVLSVTSRRSLKAAAAYGWYFMSTFWVFCHFLDNWKNSFLLQFWQKSIWCFIHLMETFNKDATNEKLLQDFPSFQVKNSDN